MYAGRDRDRHEVEAGVRDVQMMSQVRLELSGAQAAEWPGRRRSRLRPDRRAAHVPVDDPVRGAAGVEGRWRRGPDHAA